MMRITSYFGPFVLLSVLSGCGPMKTPMVPRLDDNAQQEVDAAWEKVLAPVDLLDHQTLLDVFIGTGAYERGVDKLTLHSEKRYSGGLVVMEVQFDHQIPAEDRFEVKILDPSGKLLRQERYGREEIETTYHDLFDHIPQTKDAEKEPPELAEKRAKLEARRAKVEQLFPPQSEKEQKSAKSGAPFDRSGK
jgi:hypothetical protein